MNLEQLTGRQTRLRQELALAAGSVPWNSGHIDRLTAELRAVEVDIGRLEGAGGLADMVPSPFPFFPLQTGKETA